MVRSFTLHTKEKHDAKLTPEQEENLDAAQQRQRAVKQLTVAEPGANVFQWDLHYAPAYDFPGFRTVPTDDFADTGDGPTILPGTYSVVLQYGTQTLRAPLTVRLDPRLHPGPGDLAARLALEMQILGSIDRLDRAIAATMGAASKLPPAKRAAAASAIGDLVQLDVHSSEADVSHETKIREQLAFLLNSLENAYQRPTAAEYAAYKDLDALATTGEARLQSVNSP